MLRLNKLQTTESFQQLFECVLCLSFILMSQIGLLLLSFLTVQCGGCGFDWEGVKNIKVTIDSNPTGFVSEKHLTLLILLKFLHCRASSL